MLYSELSDYTLADFFGDDVMSMNPEEHSIGISQLQINDVRDWNLSLPAWAGQDPTILPAHTIRRALNSTADSIYLLATAVKYFADQGPRTPSPGIGMNPGQPYSFAGWTSRTQYERSQIANWFTGAKDEIEGFLITGAQDGIKAYNAVISGGLMD